MNQHQGGVHQFEPRGEWINSSPNESIFYLYVNTDYVRSTAYLYQKDELAQDFILRKVKTWEYMEYMAYRNYTRYEKELYGSLRALGSFNYDVYGSCTYIYMKRDTFEALKTMRRTNTKVNRWLERLEVYDYKVTHTALDTL